MNISESKDSQGLVAHEGHTRSLSRRYWWLFDVAATVFLVYLLAWSLAMINHPTSPRPFAGERWGPSAESDFITMTAGRNFHEEGFADNYFLSKVTVGYPEFARSWLAGDSTETDTEQGAFQYDTRYGSTDGIVNGMLASQPQVDALHF